MDRNPNDFQQRTGAGADLHTHTDTTSGLGGTSGTGTGSFGGAGSYGATGATGTTGGEQQSTTERAKEAASGALNQAKDKLGQAKDKAVNLKSSLADKLEAGADKLRQRSEGDGSMAGSMGGQQQGTMNKASSAVASGMQNTAEWLRSADLDSLKTSVEEQVRTNPGRTLLVALGLGYVLGRAFGGGSKPSGYNA